MHTLIDTLEKMLQTNLKDPLLKVSLQTPDEYDRFDDPKAKYFAQILREVFTPIGDSMRWDNARIRRLESGEALTEAIERAAFAESEVQKVKADKDRQISQLRQENARIQRAYDDYYTRASKFRGQVNELTAKLDECTPVDGETVAMYKAQVEDAQQKARAAERKVDPLERKISDLEQANKQLTRAIKSAEDELQHSRTLLAHAEAENRRIDQLTDALTECEHLQAPTILGSAIVGGLGGYGLSRVLKSKKSDSASQRKRTRQTKQPPRKRAVTPKEKAQRKAKPRK